MYKPKSIVKYNNYYLSRLENKNRKTNEMLHYLNFIYRNVVYKIDEIIQNVYRQIEKDSGWTYMHPFFAFNSDFKYDVKNEDITFFMNKVVLGEDGYVSKHNNERENMFIQKYGKILERLAKLEKYKNSIYERHKDLIEYKKSQDVVYINRRENAWDNTSDAYLDYMADGFIKKYGVDGLRRLIKLLNDLADSKDTILVYENLLKENISNNYIAELLNWASSYSGPAQKINNKFHEEINQNRILLDPKTLEYIKEDGVTDPV